MVSSKASQSPVVPMQSYMSLVEFNPDSLRNLDTWPSSDALLMVKQLFARVIPT